MTAAAWAPGSARLVPTLPPRGRVPGSPLRAPGRAAHGGVEQRGWPAQRSAPRVVGVTGSGTSGLVLCLWLIARSLWPDSSLGLFSPENLSQRRYDASCQQRSESELPDDLELETRSFGCRFREKASTSFSFQKTLRPRRAGLDPSLLRDPVTHPVPSPGLTPLSGWPVSDPFLGGSPACFWPPGYPACMAQI